MRYGERRQSYRDLSEFAAACAQRLAALGVKRGDRVAIYMKKRLPTIPLRCSARFAADYVAVPINAKLHPREAAYIVENAEAKRARRRATTTRTSPRLRGPPCAERRS